MTTRTPSTEERLSRLESAYKRVDESQASIRSEMTSLHNTLLLLVIGGCWATLVIGFMVIFIKLAAR